MSANIQTLNGCMPLKIFGNFNLVPNTIDIKVPSAQIKSGILLASLNIEGKTCVTENRITRDHTEIMLKSFGANIEIKKKDDKKIIKIIGKKELVSKNISVPNDFSSSAFFIVAALINYNSFLKLKNINNNPTRNGLVIALKKIGANISFINKRLSNDENVVILKLLLQI